MTNILTFPTISDFQTGSIPTPAPDLIYIVSYNTPASGAGPKGGGFLQPAASGPEDPVLTFKNHGGGYWTRQLDGGVVDAYMAGATGSGAMGLNGVVDLTVGTSDHDALNQLFKALVDHATNDTNSVDLSIRIGDGIFRVDQTLNLTSFPFGSRGWEIDGTGATLLGTCTGMPVVDMVDSRYCTVRNLQIIGSAPNGGAVDHVP